MNQRFMFPAVLLLLWAGAGEASVLFAVSATDAATATNLRFESTIPNPFGPAATRLVSNPSGVFPEQGAYSYAEFDTETGSIRLQANDSGNQLTSGAISASANLNQFTMVNESGMDHVVTPDSAKLSFDATHSIGGAPVNTAAGSGEKTAYISYVLVMQLFDLSAGGGLLGTAVTQNRVDYTWNEDGSFKDGILTRNDGGSTGGFTVTTTAFDLNKIQVDLGSSGFTWGQDRVLDWRYQVNVFADASDAGLIASVNALSTGQSSLIVPEGIEFVDVSSELGSLGDLEYVTVQAVPLPTAGFLLPTGVIALFGYARRRRAGRQASH